MYFSALGMKTDDIPSIEDIIRAFKIIDNAGFENLDYDQIKSLFFDNIPFLPQIISFPNGLKYNVYRTRVHSDHDFDVTKLDSFRNPVKEKSEKGRVNLKGNPVFYSSLTAETALKECPNLKKGDVVYLSIWQPSEFVSFHATNFLFMDNGKLHSTIRDLNNSINEKLNNAIDLYDDEKKKAILYLYNKLAEYFTSTDYNISSFLGHFHLYDGYEETELQADCVIYPSIKNNLENFNLAFHPDYAQKFVKLKYILKLKFNGYLKDKADVEIESIGFNHGKNDVVWFVPRIFLDQNNFQIKEIGLQTDLRIESKENDVFVYQDKEYNLVQLLGEVLNRDPVILRKILLNISREFEFENNNAVNFTIKFSTDKITLKKETGNISVMYFNLEANFPILLSPISNLAIVGKLMENNIGKNATNVLCLEYSAIYKGSKEKIEDLLQDIPSESILKIICEMMGDIHFDLLQKNIQLQVINQWIGRFNITEKRKIKNAINEASDLAKGEFVFLNYNTSLKLIQSVIKNNNKGKLRVLSIDEEERLFKAYLLFSEEWTEEQGKVKSIPYKTEEDLISFYLPTQLRFYDLENSRNIICELVKSAYFFKFIKDDDKLGKYYLDFIKKNHVESGIDYILQITQPLILMMKDRKNSCVFQINKVTHEKAFLFWDNWAISEIVNESRDFIELREKPLFRLSDGRFLILSYPFLFDKFYQAIQFQFAKILIEKNVVKSYPDFKSDFYSESFSESFMFYNIIKHIIPKYNKMMDGDAIYDIYKSNSLNEKGIDFYLRIDNNVLAFEFKDTWLAGPAKTSYDYNKIKEDIFKKLVSNSDGSKKGVSQLLDFVINSKNKRKLLEGNNTDFNIYPVLVVTDNAYSAFGVNWLLNEEFKKQLQNSEFNNQETIKDLVVIPLDSLIKFMDEFNQSKLDLIELLNQYKLYLNNTSFEFSFDRFKSFSHFINYFTSNNGIKPTAMPQILFDEIASKLEN
jgi:hypothetical protein